VRAREQSLSLSLSLFYRFLSLLLRRILVLPFDLAIDNDDGEDDTANCLSAATISRPTTKLVKKTDLTFRTFTRNTIRE